MNNEQKKEIPNELKKFLLGPPGHGKTSSYSVKRENNIDETIKILLSPQPKIDQIENVRKKYFFDLDLLKNDNNKLK